MLLFWERGFEATTLSELRSALGDLSAASFYAAFGCKENLFSECLALYMRTCGELAERLHVRPDGPREAMRAMLHQAIDTQTSKDTPSGCMAVLSGFNCFGDNSRVEQEVAQARRITGAAIVECVMAGMETGELPTGTDCAALALTIDSFLKGVAIQSRDGATADTLHKGAELLMRLWGPCAPST
ncbi:helix-turn-helix domain-containing protein [Dyella sp. A6]|uniref:TetR/AcrR family transcriptional regulator n=1 Tax=Dyella aluminiiresistens TaxID=3069105 RepID=UPI002E778324|nr:helix-turn-helix domain-containing protein [Dyella sp. A6]